MKVITIGTATQDVFLLSRELKRLYDPEHLKKIGFKSGEAECFALGAKMEVEDLSLTYGGGAANTAVTFARQGFSVICAASVGQDLIGENIAANLKRQQVKARISFNSKAKSAYSAIILTPGGERTILTFRGAANDLKAKDIDVLPLRADWIYINPGSIPVSVIRRAINKYKRNKAKIAMNPSRHYLSLKPSVLNPLLNKLDVVIMNREEAAYLTGIDYDQENLIFKRLDRLVKGISVMTDGADGVLVSDGKVVYRAGVFKEKQVVDRTGAGDAFGSGFVAGLIKTKDIESAIVLGSANATSVVEQIGAQPGILTSSQSEQKRFKNLKVVKTKL